MGLGARCMGAVLLAGSLPLLAQGPGQNQPQQVQVFGDSIDVRVVNVEAVITDAKGERVRGLSAADFRLLVDGREVPIEYFTEIEEGKAAAPRAATLPGSQAPQAPVSPGEEVGRSYLVYVDDSF